MDHVKALDSDLIRSTAQDCTRLNEDCICTMLLCLESCQMHTLLLITDNRILSMENLENVPDEQQESMYVMIEICICTPLLVSFNLDSDPLLVHSSTLGYCHACRRDCSFGIHLFCNVPAFPGKFHPHLISLTHGQSSGTTVTRR